MDEGIKLNSGLMLRMVQAFNDGDVSTLDSLVSVSYVDHQGIGGSKMYGRSGFAEVVRIARDARPRLRVDIEKLVVNGDTVEAELFWYELGDSQGPESEDPYQKRSNEIVRFEGGLAVEHWGERIE